MYLLRNLRSAFLSLGSQSSRSEKMEQRRHLHDAEEEEAALGEVASGLLGHGEAAPAPGGGGGMGIPMLGLRVEEEDGEVKSQGNACRAGRQRRYNECPTKRPTFLALFTSEIGSNCEAYGCLWLIDGILSSQE